MDVPPTKNRSPSLALLSLFQREGRRGAGCVCKVVVNTVLVAVANIAVCRCHAERERRASSGKFQSTNTKGGFVMPPPDPLPDCQSINELRVYCTAVPVLCVVVGNWLAFGCI